MSTLTPSAHAPAAAPQRWWGDALAGLAVAGVLLPEAVAYAAIAGVPPMHAFLAALCGLLIYPLFGSSRLAIVAPTSSAAAIFASATAVGGADMGFALVTMTGLAFLLAALAKADFLGSFISRPVLRGFAWALAVTIVLKQIPHVLGTHAHASNTLGLVAELARHVAAWHVHEASVWLGLAALALWLLLRHVLSRWVPVPPSLVVLALGIVWTVVAQLHGGTQGVALVGQIAWQPLQIHWPQLTMDHWLRVAQIAPALLLILFAESWGSVRSLALQSGETVSTRRELTALGAANFVSSLLQGLPVGAGFSAAMANQSAGARSKAAGIAAAAALALLLWQARDQLALLPMPVLAAVVIGILSHNLWPHSVIESLRLGSDAWLALAAAASVIVFGVLFGMLVAVGLSLVLAIKRFSTPLVNELARLPGTHDFVNVDHKGLEPLPAGVLVMRPEEPLFFANAEAVLLRIRQRVEADRARIVVISMEMSDDLDSTTVEAMGEFMKALKVVPCEVLLARLKDPARRALDRAGLSGMEQSLMGADSRFFWSVDDAVMAASQATAPTQVLL